LQRIAEAARRAAMPDAAQDLLDACLAVERA
jgi:hypothetical protein